MKKILLLLLLISPGFSFAQQAVLTCFQNPGKPDGSEGDIAAKITANYNLYIQNTTVYLDISWNISPASYLFWQGKKYTIQQLGSTLFSSLSISKNISCVADAYYSGQKLAEVIFDASGCQSPNTYSNNPVIRCIKQPVDSRNGESSDLLKRTWSEAFAIWNSGKVSFRNFRLKDGVVSIYNPYPMVPDAIKNIEGEKKSVNAINKDNQKSISYASANSSNNLNESKKISSNISNTKMDQYNSNIQTMETAMSKGNYALAQESLKKANSIKPVQNYQSLYNSMDALNNYSKTGSTLSMAQQEKLSLYGDLATTGAQVIGDWMKYARERKEQKVAEKKVEEQRIIAEKRTVFFSESAKSQAGLLYEKEPSLQNALIEAYQAPVGKLNIDMIFNFSSKFFVSQEIELKNIIIKSYANKVSIFKGKAEQKLISENVNGPKLFINSAKTRLMIAYFTSLSDDSKIALQLFDLGNMKSIGSTIFFEANKAIPVQPIGFGYSDNEIVYSEYKSKVLTGNFEIVVYDYILGREVKRIKSMKVSDGSLKLHFQFNAIINGRFVKGISDLSREFLQLIDLKTERSVLIPRLLLEDFVNYGEKGSDTLLFLFSRSDKICNMMTTFDFLYGLFNKEVITKFSKDKVSDDFYKSFMKVCIGGFYVDSLKGPSNRNNEDYFVNKVYCEKNMESKFFYGDYNGSGSARINCPYDLFLSNSILLTKFNTFYKTRQFEEISDNKLVTVVDDRLYVYGFLKNKLISNRFQLDYYPLRIIDAQKNYFTVFGIDKYAFPIVKKYDVNKIFEKYSANKKISSSKVRH